MNPRFERIKDDQLNIYFTNSYNIFFYREYNKNYRMRIFIPFKPGSRQGLHFGHANWTFEARKDFFKRKEDVLEIIYDVFREYKFYILDNIFKVIKK